jgi:hypothetical protein
MGSRVGCRLMTFRDVQLQKRFERAIASVQGYPPDQLPVWALMDSWYWFRLIEGEESPRAGEAIGHLLSPELRPALRDWYRRLGEQMNPFAMEFRDHLSELVGERLG